MKQNCSKSSSDQKREQIIKVATQMFIERGYSAVTMDSIAEAAPVSKPTLYNHFENKAALFYAVMEEKTSAIFLMLKDVIEHEAPVEETLNQMGLHFLDVIMKPEAVAMYSIMISESKNFPELSKMFYEVGPRRISGLVADYLVEQHKAGRLNVPNPDLSAQIFISMIKGQHHTRSLLSLETKIPPKERAELIEYVVSVFINGHRKS